MNLTQILQQTEKKTWFTVHLKKKKILVLNVKKEFFFFIHPRDNDKNKTTCGKSRTEASYVRIASVTFFFSSKYFNFLFFFSFLSFLS